LSAEGFKTEQSAAIKFCTKLKETATEAFQMLKDVYDENAYLEYLCSNCIEVRMKGSESENAKFASEINVDCIFMLTESFIMNLRRTNRLHPADFVKR
jgi:hypothetical protein